MKRKTIIAAIFVVLLVFSGFLTSIQAKLETEIENEARDRIRLLERIRYRIRDVLGRYRGEIELTEINGTLEYNYIFFKIGDVELHFGPNWYMIAVISAYDYDQDGDNNETVYNELLGLVESGENVSVEGYLQSENWLSVFSINGIEYREEGKPIWASEHTWRWRHGKMGKLSLYLTDAPPEIEITKALVNISDVQVHKAGLPDNLTEGRWITVVDEAQTFDLITLENATAFLGSENLSEGWYTQIRLNVNEAILTIDGKNYTAKIPSNTVKIVSPFKVEDNVTTNLTLDFDIHESVHKRGQNNYIVRPTIKLIKEE